MHRYLNLLLIVLYPVSWNAPLLRAGLLPLFGLDEISILSGLRSLWESDMFLTIVVALFALIAPLAKTLLLTWVHFGPVGAKGAYLADFLGRLAMADIFLIAVYVTIAKGIGIGRIETAWGLYLFTFCVLSSLFVTWRTKGDRRVDTQPKQSR